MAILPLVLNQSDGADLVTWRGLAALLGGGVARDGRMVLAGGGAMKYWALFGFVLAVILLYLARGILGAVLSSSRKRKGDYEGALRWLRWTSLGNPSAPVLCDEGLTLCQAGRLVEAERLCRTGLAMLQARPGYPRVRLYAVLGFVLMDRGRYAEAEQSFQRAIKEGDQTGNSLSGLAELMLVQGAETEKALAYAGQAIELAQISLGRVHWAHYANRAWALALLGRAAEARESLDLALQQPTLGATATAESHWRAGMALLAMQQPEEACKHFRLGKDIDPRGKYGHRCAELLRKTE
jgi:tetratricopeptide (TPR) repeat protein